MCLENRYLASQLSVNSVTYLDSSHSPYSRFLVSFSSSLFTLISNSHSFELFFIHSSSSTFQTSLVIASPLIVLNTEISRSNSRTVACPFSLSSHFLFYNLHSVTRIFEGPFRFVRLRCTLATHLLTANLPLHYFLGLEVHACPLSLLFLSSRCMMFLPFFYVVFVSLPCFCFCFIQVSSSLCFVLTFSSLDSSLFISVHLYHISSAANFVQIFHKSLTEHTYQLSSNLIARLPTFSLRGRNSSNE
ncbi:hypothetical protein RchiOBHm_Chr3g0462641 [Rosa chinensis]|uniref:Uncharacterized protein n=1 Tax=Rosa chinensis TaxID=74649 RepID=A0A2P6R900_ROSCH|nr:hypothetical protein RchiOBHm_Chr3g0462641 [Rosa chinensis]